ncbi:MAG TPA: hypothetical protein VLF61_04385 [Rhabdochlamydiaceae bacterium]|nr:hypothetical protein [Rhabdochlamydiaceae bacterium]
MINYKLVNALIILFADNLDSIKTNSQFNDITPHKRKATKTKSHPKKPRTKTSEFIQDDHSPQPLSAPASPIHHPSEPLKKRALEIVADTVSSPIVASIDFSDPLAPLASQFSSPALEDTSSSSASISTESFDLLDPFDSQFSSPALEDTSSSSASVSAESFDLLDPFDLQFSSPALEDISSSSASVFFDSLDSFDHIDSITSQFPIATKDASSVPVHSNHVPFSISSAPAFIDSVRDHSRENRAFYGLSEAIKKRALENRQKAETRFNEPGLDFIQDLFSTFYKSEEPISVDSFENHCKKKSQEKNRPYSKEEKCSFKKYKTAIENYFLRGKKCEGIANRMSKKILQQIIDDFEDSPLPLLETIKTRIDAASRFKPVFKRKIDDHSPQHLSAPASPIHPLSEPIKKRALEADTVSSSTFASIDSFDSIDSITSQFPIGPEDASLVPIHSNHVPFSSSVPASIDSAQDHSLDFLKDLFETYYKSASTCSFNRLIAAKCDKRLDSTQKTQLLDFCNLYRRKLEDYFLSENSEVRLPAVMRKDSTFEALITNLSNYGLLEAIKKRALENKQKAESRFKEPGLHSANSAFVQKVFSTFYTSEEPISFDSFKKHCKKKLKENKGSYSKNTTMHTLTIYKTEIENYFLHGKKLDGTALKKASMTTLKKIIADLEKWPSEFIKKRIEAAKKPSRPSIPSAPSPTGSIPDHL